MVAALHHQAAAACHNRAFKVVVVIVYAESIPAGPKLKSNVLNNSKNVQILDPLTKNRLRGVCVRVCVPTVVEEDFAFEHTRSLFNEPFTV